MMLGKKLSLEEIKAKEMEILCFVDRFCKKHGIRYFLAYGTLLGAVRHKGFIPWDDDIDIHIPRQDYERFISLWNKGIEERFGLKLFSPETDRDYYYEYAKIASKDILCKINLPIDEIHGMGIWIDIFPLDGVPGKRIPVRLRLLRRLRSLSVHTELPECTSAAKVPLYMLWRLTRIIGWKYFRDRVLQYSVKYGYDECGYVACNVLAESVRQVFPREIFEKTIQLSFENRSFDAPAGYDSYLKISYGDYMQLPPEEQRVSNHLFDAYKLK